MEKLSVEKRELSLTPLAPLTGNSLNNVLPSSTHNNFSLCV